MGLVLSIVIPAKNEEENIKETIENLIPHINSEETEIIVVNDHSTDKTEEIVLKLCQKYPFLKIVRNEKEPGFANALKTGFENAKGEFVLPVMADGCDDPETIKKMIEKAKEGYDLVCGSRYTKGGNKIGGPKVQNFFSKFVGISLYYLIKIPTKDCPNAFKMYRRCILNSLKLKSKGFSISMEACLKFYFLGFKICEIPTIWYGRKKGKSKFKLLKTLSYIKLYIWALLKKWKFL
ncbi:MAG: glycosyltransferase family 2 protein [Candidatus Omnitrophica bacterium]|nr:glycosyltransferase family 2 protein [Candidatus Omnitrophota bacterium]MCM8807456.1 glycosyltransferase family 2 protein [Candidatus Omnitrophota bacterium]